MTTAGSNQDTRSGGEHFERFVMITPEEHLRIESEGARVIRCGRWIWTFHVDELRHRGSENLLEEIAQQCMQDQDSEHFQRERSEARIFFSMKGFWVDLPNQ